MPMASKSQTSSNSLPATTALPNVGHVSGRIFPRLSKTTHQAVRTAHANLTAPETATTCRALAELLCHPSRRVRIQAESALRTIFVTCPSSQNNGIWAQDWTPGVIEHLLRDPVTQQDSHKRKIAEALISNLAEVPSLGSDLADPALLWLSSRPQSDPTENLSWSSRAEAAICVLSLSPPATRAIPALYRLATINPSATHTTREAAADLLKKWLAEGPVSIQAQIATCILHFESSPPAATSLQRLDLVIAAVVAQPALLAKEPIAAAVIERSRSWPSLLEVVINAAGWLPSSLATVLRRGQERNWSLMTSWLKSVTTRMIAGSNVARETLAQCSEEEVSLWINSPSGEVRQLAWLSLGEL